MKICNTIWLKIQNKQCHYQLINFCSFFNIEAILIASIFSAEANILDDYFLAFCDQAKYWLKDKEWIE